MEQLAHIATIAASVAAIGGPTVMMAAGVVPRVGPLRAIMLGLSSRLFLRANPVSQRVQELAKLREAFESRQKDMYSVVTGPKGVGKSCVVNTATEATFGVVTIGVQAATTEVTIVSDFAPSLAATPAQCQI